SHIRGEWKGRGVLEPVPLIGYARWPCAGQRPLIGSPSAVDGIGGRLPTGDESSSVVPDGNASKSTPVAPALPCSGHVAASDAHRHGYLQIREDSLARQVLLAAGEGCRCLGTTGSAIDRQAPFPRRCGCAACIMVSGRDGSSALKFHRAP